MSRSFTDHLNLLKQTGRKGFAILIDPDKVSDERAVELAGMSHRYKVDVILVGGSMVHNRDIHHLVPLLKEYTDTPIILFPASNYQIVQEADGILFLSLISGRNPDLLIGRQVEAVPFLQESSLEIIPTGYVLVDTGKMTSAHYISNTLPIPYDKPGLATVTALAGQYLGLKSIYIDGGSGAMKPISIQMIKAVSQKINIPLIIGGGIRTQQDAASAWQAGADMIVVGSALESDKRADLARQITELRAEFAVATSPL